MIGRAATDNELILHYSSIDRVSFIQSNLKRDGAYLTISNYPIPNTYGHFRILRRRAALTHLGHMTIKNHIPNSGMWLINHIECLSQRLRIRIMRHHWQLIPLNWITSAVSTEN